MHVTKIRQNTVAGKVVLSKSIHKNVFWHTPSPFWSSSTCLTVSCFLFCSCRSKQTQAEAVKLKRIQKGLQALDDSVSNDIGILRKLIEQASLDYSSAWYSPSLNIRHRVNQITSHTSHWASAAIP